MVTYLIGAMLGVLVFGVFNGMPRQALFCILGMLVSYGLLEIIKVIWVKIFG